MARESYDLQLKELKNQIMNLGSMIEEVISQTIQAFKTKNTIKAAEIAAGDEKIDEQVRKIEQLCYNLLLRQQPIAGDLRAVSAALKMITDMERIGDHGTDISELTIMMKEENHDQVMKLVEEMAKEAMVMLIEAVDAFAQQNQKMAESVIREDDLVDRLFLQVKESIADSLKANSASAMQELDLLMVAKYLERIGDHATNIAEWVLFSITGELPKD